MWAGEVNSSFADRLFLPLKGAMDTASVAAGLDRTRLCIPGLQVTFLAGRGLMGSPAIAPACTGPGSALPAAPGPAHSPGMAEVLGPPKHPLAPLPVFWGCSSAGTTSPWLVVARGCS